MHVCVIGHWRKINYLNLISFTRDCRKTQVGNVEISDIRPPRFIARDGVSINLRYG